MPPLRFDPYRSDPDRWGFSLAQVAELVLPCLEAVGARSVAEVGAFAGDFTRVLVDWATDSGARVIAIDPSPQDALRLLAEESAALELIQESSLVALPEMALPDAVIIDGDHNYFTVSHELEAIARRADGAELPLLLLHDVGWPHARRDDYFDAEQIPAGERRAVAGDTGGLYPGDRGLRPGALPYPRSATREGGSGNGVLTALEDFVAAQPQLRLVVVPAFFGLGVVWHPGIDGAERLGAVLDPWDRNPILERLEANRVHHLAESHVRQVELWESRRAVARRDAVLRRLLESSAFSLAARLSRLRVLAGVAPSEPAVGKDEIRRALGER